MESATDSRRESPVEVEVDPRLSRGVKAFLKVLNSSGGPPLETLPPLEAREVLVNAQASVPVDLSGIEESERISECFGRVGCGHNAFSKFFLRDISRQPGDING